jgi:hypothetical protein
VTWTFAKSFWYFFLQVYAEETSTADRFRSDEAAVTLTLSDVNDNSPVFEMSHYQFLVNDTEPVGGLVGKVGKKRLL